MLAKYLLVVAAVATGVLGANSTGCTSQATFDLCKETVGKTIKACDPSDYQCLCTTHTELLTHCYALCPNDPGYGGQSSTVTSYCNAASAYATTATPTTVAKSTSTSGTSSPKTSAPTSSESSTPGQDSPSNKTTTTQAPGQTGSSADMLAPAGFLLAAAAGVMGFVL